MSAKAVSPKGKSRPAAAARPGERRGNPPVHTAKDLREMGRKLAKKYCVGKGDHFQLRKYATDPHVDLGPDEKTLMKEALQAGVEELAEMQNKMYAQDKWSLLVIFQAMDAAGKDGAIKHVMSGVNPQGCQVTAFKTPSSEEMDHDFMWRCMKQLPERGRIGIFNRSYYEEVLVVRVHEAILQAQKLPEELVNKNIWKFRYKDIRNFEKYLRRNGTRILKFFLHVSREEQKKRFIERIDNPEKNWKFSPDDVKERGYWKDYMNAYEEMIRETSTKKSPWYVIPADNKSFARMVIVSAITDAMDDLDLQYPKVSKEKLSEIQSMKELLVNEDKRASAQ